MTFARAVACHYFRVIHTDNVYVVEYLSIFGKGKKIEEEEEEEE